jgi:type IV secretory pathway VirB2 component (pilin)
MRRINWRLVVKVVGAIVVIMVLTFIVLVLTSGGYSTHG